MTESSPEYLFKKSDLSGELFNRIIEKINSTDLSGFDKCNLKAMVVELRLEHINEKSRLSDTILINDISKT